MGRKRRQRYEAPRVWPFICPRIPRVAAPVAPAPILPQNFLLGPAQTFRSTPLPHHLKVPPKPPLTQTLPAKEEPEAVTVDETSSLSRSPFSQETAVPPTSECQSSFLRPVMIDQTPFDGTEKQQSKRVKREEDCYIITTIREDLARAGIPYPTKTSDDAPHLELIDRSSVTRVSAKEYDMEHAEIQPSTFESNVGALQHLVRVSQIHYAVSVPSSRRIIRSLSDRGVSPDDLESKEEPKLIVTMSDALSVCKNPSSCA